MKKRKACKLHFYSLHAFLCYNYCLQSCSESCAWQWGGEVIVLVVIIIQKIHVLHAEEWQTLWEETDKIGYTS